MDSNRLYRRLYHSRLVTTLYGRLVGPASVEVFRERVEKSVLSGVAAGGRVLEIGVGPGLQMVDMAQARPDLSFVASDFSPRFLALAEKNISRAFGGKVPPHVHLTVADAMDLSAFADATFDGIVCVGAIKHFADPVQALREALRVLAPDGCILLADFSGDATLEQMRGLTGRFRLPAWLNSFVSPALARFFYSHAAIQDDFASLGEVRQWFEQAGASGEPEPLPDVPVWVAQLRKR